MAPLISCICLEYGRPAHVAEAVKCFLDQTIDAPVELVLLNSCPQIQYEFQHERVKVINLNERPSSLGATRNLAIEAASGQWIAVWDSDDLFAPWYLRSFASRFADGADWLWLDKLFYSEGGKIRKITQGMANTMAFTKSAWNVVGRYPELSVGEDRHLVSHLANTRPGIRCDIPVGEIGYIYNWANFAWHISGEGDDRPGRVPAWERSRLDLERRIQSGAVPTGGIVLKPSIKIPPAARIAVFLTSREYRATASPGEFVRQSKVKLIHAVERHDEPASRRKKEAWASWGVIYDQGVFASHYWKYARDATSIGDKRKLPFLKDVLAFALEKANDDDVVFLTNDDTVMHPQLGDRLLRHVLAHGPCSSQRCEFRGSLPKLTMTPEGIASLGRLHMGRDLFAGTKRWWLSVWEQLGDPVLGASDWDLHLACVVRKYYGIDSTRKNLEQNISPAELPRGLVLHQFHSPAWADKRNVATAPSQVWNRRIFKTWAQQHLPALAFHAGNVI